MIDPPIIYVLGLVYGVGGIGELINIAKKFCNKNFPNFYVCYTIINNKINEKININGVNIILGDNNFFEFSGWQSGLNYIQDNYIIRPHDIVFLLNDTVFKRDYAVGGGDYYDKFFISYDVSTLPDKWVAGYFDDFPQPVEINKLIFQKWIRSNFICFSYSCLNLVSPIVFPVDAARLFTNEYSVRFWSDFAPVSENWKAYISSWLFGEDNKNYPEYKLKWLKHKSVNKDNFEFFKKKAICIMSEHYFTARLLHADVHTYDFNIYPKSLDRHVTPYYK